MRRTHRALPLLIAALIALGFIGALAIRGDTPLQSRYYPQTGRVVREPFLSFFLEHGGVATFGYPLTDAYQDEDGLWVQTFQRAKFQLAVQGVELAPIGRTLNLGDPAGGHAVDAVFTDFYRERGGEAFFGLPLNAAHDQNGVLVQDFERARLVHDALGEIHLADLGSAYLTVFPPPQDIGQAAIHLQGVPTPQPRLRASVSVARPTVGHGEQQTIYLVLEDENGSPVTGAQALAMLRYNDAVAEVTLPDTDSRGVSQTTFIVPPALPGSRVGVEVYVLAGETFLTVETAYFQWW